MSEILERVARALCEDAGEPGDHIDPASGKATWVFWVPRARVAIEAMREPGGAVALAVASHVFEIASAQDEIDMGKACWQAGIDEALK